MPLFFVQRILPGLLQSAEVPHVEYAESPPNPEPESSNARIY